MTLVVVSLRQATTDDAARVAEVWRSAWHDGHRGRVPETLIGARDPAYFAARSVALVDHVTVAEDEDELLGVLIVRNAELQQIMGTAAARGRGVGGGPPPRAGGRPGPRRRGAAPRRGRAPGERCRVRRDLAGRRARQHLRPTVLRGPRL